MRVARPSARGRNRLSVGPSSIHARVTTSSSAGRPRLCSALAIADSRTLPIGVAAPRWVNLSTRRASSTWRPRMRFTTRRALVGEIRTKLAEARASCASGAIRVAMTLLLHPRSAFRAAVSAERTGRRELAELVPDHRLGDIDRDVLAPVVDRDRVPDHVGDDRGATGPRLDHAFFVLLVHRVDLEEQVVVDERPLLQA